MLPTRGTVLLIEDDPDVRDALALLIRDAEGYGLATAATGADALAYVQSNPPPCLILLDLHLPDMKGYALREKLRALPKLTGVPVVYLSGAVNVETSGGDTWLRKPIEIEALLALLESHCGFREAA